MKVIYKKSVLEEIEGAIQEAVSLNKEIERIELTREEYETLQSELRMMTWRERAHVSEWSSFTRVLGVVVCIEGETEEF